MTQTKRSQLKEQIINPMVVPLDDQTLLAQKQAELLRSHVINNDTASAIQGQLVKELKSKAAMRRWLIVSISLYFALVTVTILGITIFLADIVAIKVQNYLITGLFTNLIGLLVIIYRYAFADTSKLIHDLWTLTR
ncbi:hypothetical protein [Fructobacillus americanaquae]|uniref:Uncharacterized protein n=1 Tax=Fructobacillus americanaquae TaxID=2940302 RepID=A0ABY5C234_9LACO|nr:hypothetical protein [Fructobacillus americanaquae]USS92402.1 hypothetical protein M3M36_01945 [Fructobacillus americanaquae]